MTAKKVIFVITASLIYLNVFSQEVKPLKIKEVGIGIYNFQSFSLQYRWGNEKRLFRINANIGARTSNENANRNSLYVTDTSASNYWTEDEISTPVNLSLGLGFSVLKFKVISEKFSFMYGPLLGVSYSYLNTKRNLNSLQGSYSYSGTSTQKTQTIQPYLGIVIGAAYKINASFFLYAEIGPNVYYAFNQSYGTNNYYNSGSHNYEESSSKNNSIGVSSLSNSGAMLTLVYRFSN